MMFNSKQFSTLLTLVILLLSSCTKYESIKTFNDNIGNIIEDVDFDDNISYYYYFDERVPVNQLTDKVFIQFASFEHRNNFKNRLSSVSSFQPFDKISKSRSISDKDDQSTILVLQSTVGEISHSHLSEIETEEGVVSVSYLCGQPGGYYAPSNQFIAKLKDGTTSDNIIKLSEQYGCEYHLDKVFGDRTFFIERPKGCELDIYELSSRFQESGLFEYSAPDFCHFDVLLSNDPYYCDQWGLKNTGQYGPSGIDINIEQAWTITQGSSDIKVAVVDYGVDSSHADLIDNIQCRYNAHTQSAGNVIIDRYINHGTGVAGIIAAKQNNDIGISGVAPECKMISVQVYAGDEAFGTYDSDFSRGINWAWQNGADIINCSWGWPLDYYNGVYSANPAVSSAIYAANTNGRGGKGSVVIASSGNDDSSITFPAVLHNVLSVGAIDTNGQRKWRINDSDPFDWGSSYGPELDVVAPGDNIVTTKSGNRYEYDYDGTSAAAPFVSGVAALILSQYPDLREEQVRRAIELSCTKLSGYTYTMDGEYPAATRNDEVGYGLVNAYAALQHAAQMQQLNEMDAIPGIDYVITNGSSYFLDNFYVELNGTIYGSNTNLIASDPGGTNPGEIAGYPMYRGEDIYDAPGSTISNISLDLYASCPDYSGNLMIGVGVDNPMPTYYYNFAFDEGNTYTISLPNTTVPNGCRRKLYINILDPRW